MGLSDRERNRILSFLRSPRFCWKTPYQVWAELLDEGVYVCSPRTMYRLLAEDRKQAAGSRERPHSHPVPVLSASAPNQVWTWDITHLNGPGGQTFYLYAILDLYSRYVVGWTLSDREIVDTAIDLTRESYARQGIQPGGLTIHADRGSVMTSSRLKAALTELGVNISHSRPYHSSDNPFSESLFKTLKSRHDFPVVFSSREHAKTYCRTFFENYCHAFRHSGIAYLTPWTVHRGAGAEILAKRAATLKSTCHDHRQRFKGKRPFIGCLPSKVTLNMEVEP